MKIQTISYKRNKNLGNYENEALEATASIDEGESVGAAIDALIARVNVNLGISENLQELKAKKAQLEEDIQKLESQIKTATERWQKIEQFFTRLGVDLSSDDVSNIPF